MKRSSGVPKVERIKEEPEKEEEVENTDQKPEDQEEKHIAEDKDDANAEEAGVQEDLGDDISQGLTITEITGEE